MLLFGFGLFGILFLFICLPYFVFPAIINYYYHLEWVFVFFEIFLWGRLFDLTLFYKLKQINLLAFTKHSDLQL